jgi:hypothetical protein
MAREPRSRAISEDESVAHVIALDILRHAFVDLAASFGRSDAAAAGAAVESIEQHIANRMFHFRNELPNWIGGQLGSGDHILEPAARIVRHTIRGAKQQIERAAKPH